MQHALAAGRPWWDMSLTSGWLVLVLALLAIGATVAAAITWDIPRYRRVRRSLLLVATQVLTAVTLAAGVNVAGGFYASISDLVGANTQNLPEMAVGTGHTKEMGPALPAWLADARARSGPGHGVWTSLSLVGARTGYRLPAWVYVPDAYFDPSQPTRRFPVVELLAGYPGRIENWQQQGHFVPVLDRLMAEGRIPPTIFVSVTQNPVPNRDSECVDAVGGARAETYLSLDVPEALAANLRVATNRADWSLMGYSTGGYCAVDIALRHPDRFAAAISLDGYFAPAIDATTGDLFRGRWDIQRSYTPAITIREWRNAPLRFYLVVGDAELRAKIAAHEFAAATHRPDFATIVDLPGGHNWNTWTAALPGALRWLAAVEAEGGIAQPQHQLTATAGGTGR